MLKFSDDFKEHPAVIKVIGVGGGGGNAINRMVLSEIRGVEFIAVNTDAQALKYSIAGQKLQIGVKLTKGLGVGGNPQLGKQAAEEDRDLLRESLMGADMVFITAGLGGGTGTGSAPVIAEIAKELKILIIGVVTKPFMFEGKVRAQQAEQGLKDLKNKVDTLIVIPNQKLFEIIDQYTPALKAFAVADDVLRQGVQSISDIITSHGMINVDFADVKAVMSQAGEALIGLGEGQGENRARDAAHMAISSPLLENISIDGAQGVLVNITGTKDITMFEINEAMSIIHDAVSCDANVFFGQAFDDELKDKLKVTVIATRLNPKRTISESPFPIVPPDYNKRKIEGSISSSEEEQKGNLDIPAFLRRKSKRLK
ncbi:cell division protein FtsZ [bacterium]|nr:cell division protein FtsZ [bacterium]